MLLRGWPICQGSLSREQEATVPQTCALFQTHPHSDTVLLALGSPLGSTHRREPALSHLLGHRARCQHLKFKGLPVPFPKSRCLHGSGPGKSEAEGPTTFTSGLPQLQNARPTWRADFDGLTLHAQAGSIEIWRCPLSCF